MNRDAIILHLFGTLIVISGVALLTKSVPVVLIATGLMIVSFVRWLERASKP